MKILHCIIAEYVGVYVDYSSLSSKFPEIASFILEHVIDHNERLLIS